MLFKKRTLEIEAVPFVAPNTPQDIVRFCPIARLYRVHAETQPLSEKSWAEIPTPEGLFTVSYGDWIIRGIHGEFYPCKPDIFSATYEPVSDEFSEPAADTTSDLSYEVQLHSGHPNGSWHFLYGPFESLDEAMHVRSAVGKSPLITRIVEVQRTRIL